MTRTLLDQLNELEEQTKNLDFKQAEETKGIDDEEDVQQEQQQKEPEDELRANDEEIEEAEEQQVNQKESDEDEVEKKRKTGYQKLRKEKKKAADENEELRRQNQEMSQRLAALEQNLQNGVATNQEALNQNAPDDDPMPDQYDDPAAYREWIKRQNTRTVEPLQKEIEDLRFKLLLSEGQEELSYAENKYRSEIDDYDDAINHLESTYLEHMKIMNPHVSEYNLRKKIKQDKVVLAAQLQSQGMDPAEGLYRIAVSKGYVPDEYKNNEIDNPVEKVKNMKDIQKRTAPTGGGGSSAAESMETKLRTMSLAEFSKDPNGYIREAEKIDARKRKRR